MGKWSFTEVHIPLELRDEADKISQMSVQDVHQEYVSIGSPDPQEYGLMMYSGISGCGWCQIDNSTHPDMKSNPIIYLCEYYHAVGLASKTYISDVYKRACILAHRRSLRRLEIK